MKLFAHFKIYISLTKIPDSFCLILSLSHICGCQKLSEGFSFIYIPDIPYSELYKGVLMLYAHALYIHTGVFTYGWLDLFSEQCVYVFTGHERFTSPKLFAAPVRVGQLTSLPPIISLWSQVPVYLVQSASKAGSPTRQQEGQIHCVSIGVWLILLC